MSNVIQVEPIYFQEKEFEIKKKKNWEVLFQVIVTYFENFRQ